MALLKNILLWASKNDWISNKLPKYKFVKNSLSRFMPGETLVEALNECVKFENLNYGTIITYLGENTRDCEQTFKITRVYLNALNDIKTKSLGTLISVKLTQLGLDIDINLCIDNMKKLLKVANDNNAFIWIDMEEYCYLDKTLQVYNHLKNTNNNIGITLQAYLFRTENDLIDLLPQATHIRLVKGAYIESSDVSMKSKNDIDKNYLKLSKIMLSKEYSGNGFKPSFATHDDDIINFINTEASNQNIDCSLYEISMLYGIRTNLQNKLVKKSQNIKILISYGEEWFPWYIRRIAENPKNLLLLLK
tara:strand:+ start:18 stop:935 length:918 start_codon:yes stop_codon:yes gene_type:complete